MCMLNDYSEDLYSSFKNPLFKLEAVYVFLLKQQHAWVDIATSLPIDVCHMILHKWYILCVCVSVRVHV